MFAALAAFILVMLAFIAIILLLSSRSSDKSDQLPVRVVARPIPDANSILSVATSSLIENALSADERVSILSYLTDDGGGGFSGGSVSNDSRRGGATRLVLDESTIAEKHSLRIQGVFNEVLDIQNGVKDLGRVQVTVPVSPARGGDDAYRRLSPLLSANPNSPLLLLFLSRRRSTSLINGRFLGPLNKSDVEMVAELAREIKSASQADSANVYESWLRSPNPWLAWAALAKLRAKRLIGLRHYRAILESRPPSDTERLMNQMLYGGVPPAAMKSEQKELHAILQLPGKEVIAIQQLTAYIATNPVSAKAEIDMRSFHNWLVGYRAELALVNDHKAIVHALDKLIDVLPE